MPNPCPPISSSSPTSNETRRVSHTREICWGDSRNQEAPLAGFTVIRLDGYYCWLMYVSQPDFFFFSESLPPLSYAYGWANQKTARQEKDRTNFRVETKNSNKQLIFISSGDESFFVEISCGTTSWSIIIVLPGYVRKLQAVALAGWLHE